MKIPGFIDELSKNIKIIMLRTTAYLISSAIMGMGLSSVCLGQQQQSINLQKLLKENKLASFCEHLSRLDTNNIHGLSCDGIIWLTDMDLSTGAIDIDLKGKDIFQRSFLGIAFHGVDTSTYDAVYFRPFNFRATDTARKIHAVQYISMPDYPWDRLRKERNGQFEKGIIPPPAASEWFHARIIIGKEIVRVYVNHSTTPSLEVKLLNNRTHGLMGLWDNGLTGDFANLKVSKD
jgi:hypothetical protein